MKKRIKLSIKNEQEGLLDNDFDYEMPFSEMQDPQYTSVEQYIKFYNTKMNEIQNLRKRELRQKRTFSKYIDENIRNNEIYELNTSNNYYGSIVKIQEHEFLVSQAPINLTRYYDGIISFKPTHILQLTKFQENLKISASRYIPLIQNEDQLFTDDSIEAEYIQMFRKQVSSQQSGSIFVSNQNLSEIKNRIKVDEFQWYKNQLTIGNITVTGDNFRQMGNQWYEVDLQIQQTDRKQQKINCIYVYFGNWQDHGIPTCENLYNLLLNIYKNDNRLLVHCSAGIGRSAVFCVCYCIYEQISQLKQGKDLSEQTIFQLKPSIFQLVEQLRIQRSPLCIDSEEQFRFLYTFASYCITQK